MTVVVCPALLGETEPAWVASLPADVLVLPAPAGDSDWLAHTAVLLQSAPAPVVAVLAGATAGWAPRLGFAARAARRPLAGYVLVGDVLPDASDRTTDWPDAPVTVVCAEGSDAARMAALRGWVVLHGEPVPAILNATADSS